MSATPAKKKPYGNLFKANLLMLHGELEEADKLAEANIDYHIQCATAWRDLQTEIARQKILAEL